MKGAKNIGSLQASGRYQKVTCAQCGKEFVMPCESDAYPLRSKKRNGKRVYFDRYSCKVAYEEDHPRLRGNIYRDYLV